jgi:hypothetical protein
MGHERVGALPKTKPWVKVVKNIAAFDGSETSSRKIANQTLDNVRDKFESIQRDPNVRDAFKFLTELAVSGAKGIGHHSDCQKIQRLSQSQKRSIRLSLGKAVHQNTQRLRRPPQRMRSEIGMRRTMPKHLYSEQLKKILRFGETQERREAFLKSQDCSSRSTERYLNYFLDREASAVSRSIEQRDLFQKQIPTARFSSAFGRAREIVAESKKPR